MSAISQPNPLDPPLTKTIVKIVNNFKVNVRNITLGSSAELEIQLYNDGELIDIVFTTISGDDYINWGRDDAYIINYVMTWLQANYS